MTTEKILLASVNDVKDFVSAVTTANCDIDIAADRYVVDAKSIMGIFSLDLSKPLELRINSSDANEVDAVRQKISKFIIKD